ncbi:MAG TPA: GNAT family N-acetyltransferase, partial [Telluria sp.]|nr:GNAT family N-acetyltransferase [Telluria sp.]
MAAVPHEMLDLVPMLATDVDEVCALENSVFPHPWSRANFLDSLASGYDAWVLRGPGAQLAGYFLIMFAYDEAHLLDVAVAADRQGEGLGRYLL